MYNSMDDILDAVKSNCGLTNDNQFDDFIEAFCSGILLLFEQQTGRSFQGIKPFSHIHQFKTAIKLTVAPVVSIDYVGDPRNHSLSSTTTEDEVPITYEQYKDFYLDQEAGIITFKQAISGFVEVTGTHGYKDIPEDIGTAVVIQASLIWQRRSSLGNRTMQSKDGSLMYQEKMGILDICKDTLDGYRL